MIKRYFLFILLFVFVFNNQISHSKSLDQKKEELKAMYEDGAISKNEYEAAKKMLTNKKDKKVKKQKFSLGKKKKKEIKLLNLKKNEDEEEITQEKIAELGEIVKFDDSYYPETLKKEFKGCNNSFGCRGKKAGGYLFKVFSAPASEGQKYPGKMIKAMAMFEIFYAEKLYSTRKSIDRFFGKSEKIGFIRNDEDNIRSLFGINKGRKSMRAALGMTMETPTKEAIQKFWLLGEFLSLGQAKYHDKPDPELLERQKLIDDYKLQIANLKKKLENDKEEKEKEIN